MSLRGSGPEIFMMKPRPESKRNRPKNLTKNNRGFDLQSDWQPIPPP